MEQFTCSLLFLCASGAGPELKEMTHVLPSQALPYVCLLIAMLFFIYAIIGMQVGTDSSAHSPPARPCAQHHAARQPARVPSGVPGVGELVQEPQRRVPCGTAGTPDALLACTPGDVGAQLGTLCGSCSQITTASFHRHCAFRGCTQ